MTDLLLPSGLTPAAAADRLGHRPQVRSGRARDIDRTFYDTFDGRLHAKGLALERADGELVLDELVSGQPRARLAAPAPDGDLRPEQLPQGHLRRALTELVAPRALLVTATVHSRERALTLVDDEGKAVVRMVLAVPEVKRGEGKSIPLAPRLRLTPVRGYQPELSAWREELIKAGFAPAQRPLAEEAVLAAGGQPSGQSAKVDVALSAEQRGDGAAVVVLTALQAVMQANLNGAIADLDIEFLHDFRVSLRRSRAVQRELRPVFPSADLARFRADFRWLQQVSGDARDLDVYLAEFDDYRQLLPESMRGDLEPLRAALELRRRAAHRKMVSALRSRRATELQTQWAQWLAHLVEYPLEDRSDGARPIGELAGQRIAKVYRRMVRMGRAIGPDTPAEEYHELRKQGKELRYLLELFATPLYPSEVVKPMVAALKELQDVLGRHQDREVQVATLRSLADDVAARPDGARAVMAMGVLIERLSEDERAARAEFAPRFERFAAREQRRLVRSTFNA